MERPEVHVACCNVPLFDQAVVAVLWELLGQGTSLVGTNARKTTADWESCRAKTTGCFDPRHSGAKKCCLTAKLQRPCLIRYVPVLVPELVCQSWPF